MENDNIENVRSYMLDSKRNRYKILLEIFTVEEILQKPVKFLFYQTLTKLDIKESDLTFIAFKNGIIRLKKSLQKKYDSINSESAKIINQSITNGISKPSNSVIIKNDKKPENNWIEDFMKKNPPPAPENNKSIDDLIIPIY